MPRIRSADEIHGDSIYIRVTRENLREKISRMRDDVGKDTSSYLTSARIDVPYIDAVDLATLISLVPGNLEKLKVKGRVSGDLSLVAEELSHSLKLSELTWSVTVDQGQEEGLTSVGVALTKLPKLEKLEYACVRPPHPQSHWFLSNVVVPVLQAADPVLRNLDLSLGPVPPGGWAGISNFLNACKSSTSLSYLFLYLSFPMTDCVVSALGQLIRETTSLSWLQIYTRNARTESDTPIMVDLAQSLKDNQSLRFLKVENYHGRSINETEAGALCEALEKHNYTLENLQFLHFSPGRCREIYREQIHFYLDLNKAGRAKLMGTPTKKCTAPTENWYKALADQSASVIYYFLQANPTLFSRSTVQKKSGKPSSLAGQKRGQPSCGSVQGSSKRQRTSHLALLTQRKGDFGRNEIPEPPSFAKIEKDSVSLLVDD